MKVEECLCLLTMVAVIDNIEVARSVTHRYAYQLVHQEQCPPRRHTPRVLTVCHACERTDKVAKMVEGKLGLEDGHKKYLLCGLGWK